MKPQTLMSKPAVLERIGISATTLWRMVMDGNFPQPIKISANRVGWLEQEVNEWIQSRIDRRGTK